MSSPLDRALEMLHGAAGNWTSAAAVERVDVGSGGALHLIVSADRGKRWFRADGAGLTELTPWLDPRLPLAASTARCGNGAEVLAYRPGRRLVLERRGSGAVTVLKGYRRRRSQAAAQACEIAGIAAAGGGLRVPVLLEHRRRRETLCFEHLPGVELGLSRQDAERFFVLGDALRRFQEAPVGDRLAVFGPRDELAVLDRWAGRAQAALEEVPEGWERARRRLGDLSSKLPPPELALTHRDLHDRQLLETGRGLALLDFDLLCRADVTLDAANLLAHLSLRALQGVRGADETSVEACARALLDGLDRSEEAGFWEKLRFYQATSYLRLALVYSLRPRWQRVCGDLVTLGRRSADELAEMVSAK